MSRPKPPAGRVCCVADCGGDVWARGLCGRHYQAWRLGGGVEREREQAASAFPAAPGREFDKMMMKAFPPQQSRRRRTRRELASWELEESGENKHQDADG